MSLNLIRYRLCLRYDFINVYITDCLEACETDGLITREFFTNLKTQALVEKV